MPTADEGRAANDALAALAESGVAPDGVKVTITPSGKVSVGVTGMTVTGDNIGSAVEGFSDKVNAAPESTRPAPEDLTTRTVHDHESGETGKPVFE